MKCKKRHRRVIVRGQLVLPLSGPESEEVSVGDLYLRYCVGEGEEGSVFAKCEGCREEQVHNVRRRVVGRPNVLVLQVGRSVPGQRRALRHPVRPESRLNFEGLGHMELWAVVYHSGANMCGGHYSSACRGADGLFWRFDDKTRQHSGCGVLGNDVELVRQREV